LIGSICRDSLFAPKIIDIAHSGRQPRSILDPNRGALQSIIASSRKWEGSFSWLGIKHTKRVGWFVHRDSDNTPNNPWKLILSFGPWKRKVLDPWWKEEVDHNLAPKGTSTARADIILLYYILYYIILY
jgi:hypothetical protein